MVDTNALCEEMVARAINFSWNIKDFKRQIAADKSYLFNFSILRDHILQFGTGDPMIGLSKEEVLHKLSYKIYFTYKACENDLQLFGGESPFGNDIYEVYFFSLLSYYLHTTKRISGKTLRNFVKDHHPERFNDPDSRNYQNTQSFFEVELLRKARHRHLSKGDVYLKTPQWSAIAKDAEHEWSFYYAAKDAGETAQDTFKRFGNLYNDIDKAIHLTKKDGDKEHLRQGYEKFLSKLKKIEYKNYVELIQAILSHINDNTEYSGLNLYRLERKLQPYRMINEVNGLL